MRQAFFYLFFFFLPGYGFSVDLTEVQKFGSNPGNLRMYYFVPADSVSAKLKPLLIVLHGCSQTAAVAAKQTGWDKLASMYGFYVLYPEQKQVNNPSMCFDWFRPDDIAKGKGEAFSIREMVRYMQKKFPVDTNRVCIAGLSAGAAMAVAMMADYPSLFSAGAVFAGGPYQSATDAFSAMRMMTGFVVKTPQQWGDLVRKQNPGYTGKYPKLLLFHGTQDPIVDPRNSRELIKQWCDLQGIDTLADETKTNFAGEPTVTKFIFTGKTGEQPVVYYEVKNGGHALMIDTGACINKGGSLEPFTVLGKFHSTYWAAIDMGLIPWPGITAKINYTPDSVFVIVTAPDHPGSSYRWFFTENGQRLMPVDVSFTFTIGRKRSTVSPLRIDLDEDAGGCVYTYEPVNVNFKPE